MYKGTRKIGNGVHKIKWNVCLNVAIIKWKKKKGEEERRKRMGKRQGGDGGGRGHKEKEAEIFHVITSKTEFQIRLTNELEQG